MAEAAAAVTDTHALLIHAGDRIRLGRKGREYFDAAEKRTKVIFVPAAVVWECSTLAHAAKILLPTSVPSFFTSLFSNPSFQHLDLGLEQALLADESRPNDDPFDALIVAAARHLGLPLITRDRGIVDSGLVETVW